MFLARAALQDDRASRGRSRAQRHDAMSAHDPQARLTDLETRLAYQEDTLEKLDAVIAGQARSIASLEAGLDRLARRLDGLQQDPPADESEQRPPHY